MSKYYIYVAETYFCVTELSLDNRWLYSILYTPTHAELCNYSSEKRSLKRNSTYLLTI